MGLSDKLKGIPRKKRADFIQRYIDKAQSKEDDLVFQNEIISSYKANLINKKNALPP